MENDLNSNSYLAKTIDHTLLKPEATINQIQSLVETAKQYGFFSVCLQPSYVASAAKWLQGSGVLVCTVIGFPLGANTTETKAFETKKAISDGADEIDMVINIGALKSKNYLVVEKDINEVVKAAEGHTVKVILETALLSAEEISMASKLSQKAGAHFVKTSTGFNGRGASLEDIAIMKAAISPPMQIKASGGIKDTETAKKMLDAGASRLGTSSGVAIVEGQKSSENY
jgi:deoxyribose-phosphate aldolase